MDLQLKGRRALVTGSSGGIGEAIARRLAAEGASVVVHGRNADGVRAVTRAIKADGGDAQGLAADLADPAQCEGVPLQNPAATSDVRILETVHAAR